MDDLKEIKEDIKNIQLSQTKVAFELSHYNSLLATHIKRTEQLETRVKPIEDHVMFLRKLMKLIAWSAGFSAGAATFVKVLLKI